MKYLCQGMESRKKIELLLSLTKISGESLTMAIDDHFVKNFAVSVAAMINGCQQSNLTVAIKKLNKIAEVVEKINELGYK